MLSDLLYIRPDLEEDVVHMGDRWYIHCRRIINGAACGLMKALIEGWRLRNGTWDTKILEMVAVNQYGWYDDVTSCQHCPCWSCMICSMPLHGCHVAEVQGSRKGDFIFSAIDLCLCRLVLLFACVFILWFVVIFQLLQSITTLPRRLALDRDRGNLKTPSFVL